MKKTSLIPLAVLLGISLVVAACPAPAPVELAPPEPIELSLAHFMSTRHIMHTGMMVPFVEEVEKATDGRVRITIFPGGALGTAPGQFDAAVTGIADIAFGIHGFTPGRFPLVSIMEFPFLVPSAEAGSHALWELWEKFPEIVAEHPDVKVLSLWTCDVTQIMTTERPIHTLDDFRGMKIRAPTAMTMEVLKALGATPVMMPIDKLYEALQLGVIDGTLVPFSGAYSFRLHEVVKHATEFNVTTSTFFMVMNLDSWNKISPEDQEIIEGLAGRWMSERAGKVYDAGAKLGIEALAMAGIEVYTLPANELAKWKDAVAPVGERWIADIEGKGLPGRAVHEAAVKLAEKFW